MMNKLWNRTDEDEALKLRMDILNRLSPEEQQTVKRGFEPQMKLISIYESQIQRNVTELNRNATFIDTCRDFGSESCEQQDEFQEDFVDEIQYLEVRLQDKKLQEPQPQKTLLELEKALDSHLGPLFGQMNYSGPPGKAPDQSNTKLRLRQPTSRRQKIVPLTQTNPQSQTTPYPNQNYNSNLNVDFIGIITNPFSVPKEMQHQQIAGEAAQVYHAPRETFSTNGNVRKEASSTDRIVQGQVGVAGTKPINTQSAPSIQLQGNPIREPKVVKKGGKTPVRGKATNINTSVVANQNQSEDQQR
ncbi:MAG: hypothetical protein EZS28_010635 [Streblomastix strix]|uniref:Uncharacterized protein n=1 Tax=Streblomastix strix TaxID=222440 RepID=A0A5J4WGN2_9EUKA|nr:MAG: hypothetical protein EZS28_010635 [Streblomastix strix]